MKNNLISQSSEYDCGPTSVTNAIRYLFERGEIPPAVLKHIWTLGVDTFSVDGEMGKEGTSRASMRYMAAWLECFAEKCRFPIKATFLDAELASVEPGSLTWNCIRNGGCAIVRCLLGGDEHYVLLTRVVGDDALGLFDPYEVDQPDFAEDIRVVEDQPKVMNRVVSAARLNRSDRSDYAMGGPGVRETMLFWRSDRARE